MRLILTLLIIAYGTIIFAQDRPVILDGKLSGGFFSKYTDLGDNGFVVDFANVKPADRKSQKPREYQHSAFFYSKDLSKRALMRYSSFNDAEFYANNTNIFLVDKNSDYIKVKVFDFNGRYKSEKRVVLSAIGLRYNMVQSTFFGNDNKIYFEVYDMTNQLHLYSMNVASGNEILTEIDIPIPSHDLLSGLREKSEWKLLGVLLDNIVLYRKGMENVLLPKVVKIQLAMYNSSFKLQREYLIENFLTEKQTLAGSDISLLINQNNKSIYLGAYIKSEGEVKATIIKYHLSSATEILNQQWRINFDLINNETNRFIDPRNLSLAITPIMHLRGTQTEMSLMRNLPTANEEMTNQLILVDDNGKVVHNAVQTGNFFGLSLDGYCVDAQQMYTRIYSKKMNVVLKSNCENKGIQVLDVDFDDNENELLILHDESKNQVFINTFKH